MIFPPPDVLDLFEQRVRPAVAGEAGRGLVDRAFRLATRAHHGQTRDEGTPYIEHPVRVAGLLAGTGFCDPEVLAAALLHDTIEDCDLTEAELASQLTPRVGQLVLAVTKRLLFPDRPPMVDFSTMPLEAKAIKLADRLDNLQSLHRSPVPWKRERMLEETSRRYLKVAREVGGPLGQLFLDWWTAHGGWPAPHSGFR